MLESMKAMLEEKFGLDPEDVTVGASFKNDLGLDSLDLFELLLSLEEEYGIEADPASLSAITTVGDALSMMEELGIED